MAGASEDGEVNYWPAFVDVLTAVIMVVTFLLVIMSAAIMELSKRTVQVMQQKMISMQRGAAAPPKVKEMDGDKQVAGALGGNVAGLQPVSSPADSDLGSSISQLGSPLMSDTATNGKDKLSILTRDSPDTKRIAVKAQEQPKETVGARVTSSSTMLRIDFEREAIRYTDEDAQKVIGFLKGALQPGRKYEIWSLVPGTGAVSQPMRTAYYRALMTRNLVIQAGANPEDVTTQTRVVDPTSNDGDSVRVVVKN